MPDIEGKTIGQIMLVIYDSVKKSYKKHDMPYASTEFENISEESLGAWMQMKMIETVYLARLMGVNAFDEPAVEAYKKETRKILSKSA